MFPKRDYTSGRRVAHHNEPVREWASQRSDITTKARIVCATCNNGWMSVVESDTIPILKPMIEDAHNTIRLSRHDQRLLTNWAVLRSMVFDRSRGYEPSYHSPQSLRAFVQRSDRKPSPNTHVWLSRFNPTIPRFAHSAIHSRVNDDRTVGYKVFNCVFGQVAFQVFHWKGFIDELPIGSEISGKRLDLRRLSLPVWRDSTLKVWPNPGISANWPPQGMLGFSNANAFLNRFVIELNFLRICSVSCVFMAV
jgi:hypothetical protein